jgi:hypothetical protein
MRAIEKFQGASAAILLAAIVAESSALAQQPAPAAGAAPPAAATPATSAPLKQEELDQLLAPIALYPDSLIAQILMASTYPLEVVEAARWAKANPNLKEKALEDALQKESWEASVKALTAVPQVLKHMNENLAWTQKLGDAFLADQKTVLATVQSLRAKANQAGNLKSTPEQTVKTETVENKTVYVIESAKPETVYVPTYNPSTIYGPWPYTAYPPYYMYPPGYAYAPGLAFATGVFVGAAIWGNCNWGGGGSVNVNVNKYNNFNKANINNGNFNHAAEHRKGVAYKDQGVAQKYNRGGDAKAAQSRDQFRGRAEQGRAEMGSMDRGQLQNSVAQADRDRGGAGGDRGGAGGDRGGAGGDRGGAGGDRGGAGGDRGGAGGDRGGAGGGADRDVGGGGGRGGASPSAGNLDSSRGGSGGFSGAGGGASTRDASSRGSASRSSMGGGGGGGGGRGGGGGGGRGGGGRR